MTRDELLAQNERLGAEVAALRTLLTAVRELADMPVPADYLSPGYGYEVDRRIGLISVYSNGEASVSTHAVLICVLHDRAQALRTEAARPVRYAVKDAEPAPAAAQDPAPAEPEYPAPGSAIPPEQNGGMTGYVVGECGHRVAGSEWRAGFRTCEGCGINGDFEDDDEPASVTA